MSACRLKKPAKPLTVEKIYAHGTLIGALPAGIAWSPDGQHLTYLDGGELIDLDPESGKPHVLVSRAKLAALDRREDGTGSRSPRALRDGELPVGAGLASICCSTPTAACGSTTCTTERACRSAFTGWHPATIPNFRPMANAISFVRDHSARGGPLARWRQRRSTSMAAPRRETAMMNGEVDWVYEEELDMRSNYFWSPDSKNLAFLQMNESQVPRISDGRLDPDARQGGKQRYPQPGDLNPEVRVGVVSARAAKTIWMQRADTTGQDYIPRFGWVDRKTLWVETLTRDHKHRRIYFADAGTGQAHCVLEIHRRQVSR